MMFVEKPGYLSVI